ncbi:g11975 [Coccomyxa viridis]|uniref:ER membrane protein complex subunit 2 n=1 Tax=Coccomyxa viridis TaxID=1274662 RepID=A0ABP1GDK6_9CHLO
MQPVSRQLETALADIEGGSKAGASDAIRKYLQLVRERKVRESENVALLGSKLLRQYKSKLQVEELWLIMEQVAIAAIDTRALDLAAELIKDIKAKFPESERSTRLAEMYLEARGSYQQAEALILEELEQAPDSQMLLKRQVALEKTKGNLAGAIEALRKYVDTFQTDREAWEELGHLYLEAQMYPQAATCYEELLMHQPASAATHVQYADVLYTIGGAANYQTARTHYSAAIEISSGRNARALYGLCATSAQLRKGDSRDREGKVPGDLAELAGQNLLQLYSEEAPSKLPLVAALLKAQRIPIAGTT